MRTDIVNKIDLMCEECGYRWTINPQPLMMPDAEWLVLVCPNCLKTTTKLDWRGGTKLPLESRGYWSHRYSEGKRLVVLPSTYSVEEM